MPDQSTGTKIRSAVALALYVMLVTAALPLVLLYFLWRRRRDADYGKRWAERFGFCPPAPVSAVWIHAASVGEVNAAEVLVKQLHEQKPERAIVISTMTPTGSARVRELFGETVSCCYIPFDWPPFVALFLLRLKPAVLVIVETELWPITIAFCRGRQIPVVLANARMSQHSANRYAQFSWLTIPMMETLHVATQHENDAWRFLELGVKDSQLSVSGSIKFDLELSPQQKESAARYRESFVDVGVEFCWIAASTHSGEEEVVLRAHKQFAAGTERRTLLLLVPRHPERFDEVAALCLEQGLALQRFSEGGDIRPQTEVLLVDEMGQLLTLYGAADLAFVGGSLQPVGGHNMLEPALWAVPVITGPGVHNFAEIAAGLESVNALRTVRSEDDIVAVLRSAANEELELYVLGAQAGRRYIESQRGAQDSQCALILDLLAD